MDLLTFLSSKVQGTSPGVRNPYRKDLAKALIMSYPEGTVIRNKEFAKLMCFPENTTGAYTLILRMIARGEISKTKAPGQDAYTYTVLKQPNDYTEEMAATGHELKKEGYVNPAQVYAQRLRRAKEAQMIDDELTKANEFKTIEVAKELEQEYPKDNPTYNFEELEKLAMKFAFYRPVTSTVQAFLEWLKTQ